MISTSDKYVLRIFLKLLIGIVLLFFVILMTIYLPIHYSQHASLSVAFAKGMSNTVKTMSYMHIVCCMIASSFTGIYLVSTKNIIVLKSLTRSGIRIMAPILYALFVFWLYLILIYEGPIKKYASSFSVEESMRSGQDFFFLERAVIINQVNEEEGDFYVLYLKNISARPEQKSYKSREAEIIKYIGNKPVEYKTMTNISVSPLGDGNVHISSVPDKETITIKTLQFEDFAKVILLERLSQAFYSPIRGFAVIKILKQNGKDFTVPLLSLYFAFIHTLLIFPVSIFSFGICTRSQNRVPNNINLVIKCLIFTILSIIICDMFVLYRMPFLNSVILPMVIVLIISLFSSRITH